MGKRSVVGICPSALLAEADPKGHPALMAGLVTKLVTAGDLVVLFPNARHGRFDADPRDDDLGVISKVLDALHADVRVGAVAMEEFGLGRYVLDDAGATVPLVESLVDDLRSDLPRCRALIESRLDGVRRLAMDQIDYVADTYLAGAPPPAS